MCTQMRRFNSIINSINFGGINKIVFKRAGNIKNVFLIYSNFQICSLSSFFHVIKTTFLVWKICPES